MARNSEKAMTTLARWRAAHLGAKEQERRPYLATECDDLKKAEKWRRQIIGEITRRVAQIQNAGLGEFRLRDLNDEINKLMREKGHWEDRVLELGGPHYKRIGPKMIDQEGKEVPGNRGYKYFGAAKDLPGVRELFEAEAPSQARRTRGELMKDIDANYYGYRDDDDGVIVPIEKKEEKEAILHKVAEWKARKEKALLHGEKPDTENDFEEDNIFPVRDDSDEDTMDEDSEEQSKKQLFIAHVPVPSQKEIEEALVERKRVELLLKYASDDLLSEFDESKNLLGLT